MLPRREIRQQDMPLTIVKMSIYDSENRIEGVVVFFLGRLE